MPSRGALLAFVRGVERRAAVFAELQAGDPARGDAAVAGAVAAFVDDAAGRPMPEWPRRFWAALVARPELAGRVPVALALDRADALDALNAGPRAAALLRLAAGLDDADAAAALGVSEASYRLALGQAALAGGPLAEAADWQRLHAHVQRRIQALPADRLRALAAARDRALHGAPAAVPPAWAADADASRPADARSRGVRRALWIGVALCALALAATFVPAVRDALFARLVPDAGVQVEPLPPADAPRVRLDATAALLAHPDFVLLSDADGEAAAADLAFHAWLAAQEPGERPAPVPLVPAAAGEDARPVDVDGPDAL